MKIPMFKCQVETPHLYPLPSGEKVRVRGGLEFDIWILTFEIEIYWMWGKQDDTWTEWKS